MVKKIVKAIFSLSLLFGVLAQLNSVLPVSAQGVSQGYSTEDSELVVGMTASLSQQSSPSQNLVERASSANQDRFVGVVTTIDKSLITLSDKSAKVHVATSGEQSVYVSTLDGEIKKGDFLTVSPLKGIATRSSEEGTYIIGVALEDFSKSSATKKEVEVNDGTKKEVEINLLKMDVSPRSRQGAQKAFILTLGKSITGRPVSEVQLIVALIIFFILIIIEGSIIYGAIYSTITALGRNPLARTAIYRQLLQVSIVALLILACGLGAIYAVLWT